MSAANQIYVLVGQDPSAKDEYLARIKCELFSDVLQQFNCDTMFGPDLTIKFFQERLAQLPLKVPKRLLIIKEAQALKDDVRKYLVAQGKNFSASAVLVFDFAKTDLKDQLFKALSVFAKVVRFQETVKPDVFILARAIETRQAHNALKILHQLFDVREQPERILGGLRYAFERSKQNTGLYALRMRALLRTDADIKTGKLKADFAIEKMIVKLCSLEHPLH